MRIAGSQQRSSTGIWTVPRNLPSAPFSAYPMLPVPSSRPSAVLFCPSRPACANSSDRSPAVVVISRTSSSRTSVLPTAGSPPLESRPVLRANGLERGLARRLVLGVPGPAYRHCHGLLRSGVAADPGWRAGGLGRGLARRLGLGVPGHAYRHCHGLLRSGVAEDRGWRLVPPRVASAFGRWLRQRGGRTHGSRPADQSMDNVCCATVKCT